MQQFATAQLNSDFGGQAQKTITSRTIDWPGGDMDVTAPKIEIRSISLDQDSGTATLQTKETWNVKTDSGQTLINENDAKHMITMQNYANNGLLGQWTVSEIH